MIPPHGAAAGSVAISCAFEENAIRAISHTAHQRGILTTRAVSDKSLPHRGAGWINGVLRKPSGLDAALTKHAAKAKRNSLPEDVPASPISEFVRIAGGRYRTPLTHSWGNATWKVLHDRAARTIDFGQAKTLISMPGSSLETFKANAHRHLVLHEIDAHPRSRNSMLEQFFGASRARAEMYPKRFVERIEAEIELADQVLVPGRVVGNQMRAHGVASEKLLTVPYGVDPSVFQPGASDRRGQRGQRLQAVFTGQVCLRKGVPFLLEAVRNQPIDLTIVGQVFDKRIVRNLPSNVTLAGILTPQRLSDLYAEMDVFVLPSIEDCFALVVAEAAGAGLPVITTSENGSHELLSERHTVLDAGDAAGLRDALASHSRLDWDSRQEIAHETLNGGFSSWDVYADRVLQGVSQ